MLLRYCYYDIAYCILHIVLSCIRVYIMHDLVIFPYYNWCQFTFFFSFVLVLFVIITNPFPLVTLSCINRAKKVINLISEFHFIWHVSLETLGSLYKIFRHETKLNKFFRKVVWLVTNKFSIHDKWDFVISHSQSSFNK